MNTPEDATIEPASQRRPRLHRTLDLDTLAGEDLGLVCHACRTVTIFSADATYPRCCSRCTDVLRGRRGENDDGRITLAPVSS